MSPSPSYYVIVPLLISVDSFGVPVPLLSCSHPLIDHPPLVCVRGGYPPPVVSFSREAYDVQYVSPRILESRSRTLVLGPVVILYVVRSELRLCSVS